MTGPEHYKAAERLLAEAVDSVAGGDPAPELLAAAQVHATLALTAATALCWHADMPVMDSDNWLDAAASTSSNHERPSGP